MRGYSALTYNIIPGTVPGGYPDPLRGEFLTVGVVTFSLESVFWNTTGDGVTRAVIQTLFERATANKQESCFSFRAAYPNTMGGITTTVWRRLRQR